MLKCPPRKVGLYRVFYSFALIMENFFSTELKFDVFLPQTSPPPWPFFRQKSISHWYIGLFLSPKSQKCPTKTSNHYPPFWHFFQFFAPIRHLKSTFFIKNQIYNSVFALFFVNFSSFFPKSSNKIRSFCQKSNWY